MQERRGSRRRLEEKPPSVGRASKLLGVGFGAVAMYFLDPQMGRTRRSKLTDRTSSWLRKESAEAGKKARYHAGQAAGIAHKISTSSRGEQVPPNDPALQAKVETEVFGTLGELKGKINVNVEGGTATLRGELESQEQIDAIEQRTRKVTGVIEVVNLLHLPGQTPANQEAMRTDPGAGG